MPLRPNRVNAILIAAAVGVGCVAGLVVHGPVGGILLLAVVAVLVTVSRGAWSVVRPEGRPLRVIVVVALVAVAVLKLAGRL